MKNIYSCILLLLGLFFASCNTEEAGDTLSGSTTLEDQYTDYSIFIAEVADLFTVKTAETKATVVSSSHIGYANEDNPELAVVFEGVSEPVYYTYDVSEEYYYLEEGVELPDAEALYMYSVDEESDSHGALVAAVFPEDFNTQAHNTISLKNMKARISVSYKYEQEGVTDMVEVDSVTVGSVYIDGELGLTSNGNVLAYSVATNSTSGDVSTYQVNTVSNLIDTDAGEVAANFTTGSFECFLIPQSLTAYEHYVTFYIEGQAYTYFLSSNLAAEANVTYSYVFSIKQTDKGLSMSIVSQSSVQEWEVTPGLTLDINPDEPIMSEWDGTSSTPFSFGDGTEDDPYLIESAAHLQYYVTMITGTAAYQTAYYKLMINIDWKKMSWTRNGTFGGTFDGNGYLIKNLTVSDTYQNSGFAGKILAGGTVKNLTIKGTVTASDERATSNFGSTGGITGNAASGTLIENCHFVGDVTSGYQVGGIAGCGYGTIKGCTVTNSNIIAEYNEDDSRTFENNKYGYCGAIAGLMGSASIIQHCLVDGCTLTGYSYCTAGIVGKCNNNASTYITNCYVTDDNEFSTINGTYALIGLVTPTGATYNYGSYNYHSMPDMLDTLLYLDVATYSAQEITNALNTGSTSTEFTVQNSTEWYWKLETGATYPTPTYYPSEVTN